MKKSIILMIALVLLMVLALNSDALAHRRSRVFVDFGFFFPITPYPVVAAPAYSYYPPAPYYPPEPARHWEPGRWVLRQQAPGIYDRVWEPGHWVYR